MRTSSILSGRIRSLIAVGLTLTLCLSLGLLGGCVNTGPSGTTPGTDPSDRILGPTKTPASYEEVYQAVQQTFTDQEFALSQKNTFIMEDSEASSAGGDMLSSESVASTSSSTNSSETNVQVAGIDEGDIVKNNGKNIFLISDNNVIIAEADGAKTKELSRIPLNGKTLGKSDGAISDYGLYPSELYVEDDVLMVLYEYSTADQERRYGSSTSEVALFDIADPADPKLIETFGQDGGSFTSRLNEGVLYLVSTYHMYSEPTEDEPSTYIPALYARGSVDLVEPVDICILPDHHTTSYTVVSSIDAQKAQRIDTQSVLGAGGSIYMSHDNLYLSMSNLSTIENNSYQDGSFTVTEYTESFDTRIAKIALNAGDLEYLTDTLVAGTILNQFSLDEYDDHLRLVTTVDRTDYRTIADWKGDVTDYDSFEYKPTTNSLHVFDSELNEVGSIEGLAEDERIYSARFDGEIGYFVTFRQVDPLFAVDLSDPHDPVIKSELKIPGFSSYLHVYSEDRLFGLGMAANDDGLTEGLKLSMFDTSDPYNVTEKHVLNLEDHYHSEGLYDHNAIIVSPEHDLIGFPVEEGYVVYGYSDEQGFYLRSELENKSESYYASPRGLYIGEYFYLAAADSIRSYDLETLKTVGTLTIDREDSGYEDIRPLAD